MCDPRTSKCYWYCCSKSRILCCWIACSAHRITDVTGAVNNRFSVLSHSLLLLHRHLARWTDSYCTCHCTSSSQLLLRLLLMSGDSFYCCCGCCCCPVTNAPSQSLSLDSSLPRLTLLLLLLLPPSHARPSLMVVAPAAAAAAQSHHLDLLS
eukprot:m.176598 g.176598  ORF g.176598 m.176598 type:complete len:152 (-) comp15344_c3_seq1:121-576(-)